LDSVSNSGGDSVISAILTIPSAVATTRLYARDLQGTAPRDAYADVKCIDIGYISAYGT